MASNPSQLKDPLRQRVGRWVQTPPGIIGLIVALIGLGVSVYLGFFKASASDEGQGPRLETGLDFAVAASNYRITPSDSALSLTFLNRGPKPVQIVEITTDSTWATEPVPSAHFNPKTLRFDDRRRPPNLIVDSEQSKSLYFSTKTLLALRPRTLKVGLATGKTITIDLRPFIGVLRCAGIAGGSHCEVAGLPRGRSYLIPLFLSEGGLVALYPRQRRKRLSSYCAKREEYFSTNPRDEKCINSLAVNVWIVPAPGAPIDWDEGFPSEPKENGPGGVPFRESVLEGATVSTAAGHPVRRFR